MRLVFAPMLGIVSVLLSACAASAPNVVVVPEVVREYPSEWVHERDVGAHRVRITADPALQMQVDGVYAAMREMIAGGGDIFDGTYLPIGWTTLRLEDRAGVLVVREPNYDALKSLVAGGTAGATNPVMRDDLSTSLRVLGAQWEVLNISGAALSPVNFDQHVLIAGDALTNEQVFLMRVTSPGGRLTGWRLAPSSWDGTEDLAVDSIPVYELMRHRPALMAALLLPAGSMAYFRDDALSLVLDGGDQVLYRAPEIPARP